MPPDKDNVEYKPRKSLEEDIADKEEKVFVDYPISSGLTSEEAAELLKVWGRNELPEKKKPAWLVFLELLWQPMPVMIWIAIIIEAAILNYIDCIVLLVIQFANAFLSFYETQKAGKAVEALKKSLKPTAVVKRDGNWDHNFNAALLVPGDLIQLELGAAIPADCMLNEGVIEADESAMTGESLPVTLHARMMAKMGATVSTGETEATVVHTGKNSFFGRTAALLTPKDERSSMQTMLLKVMVVLVALSLVLSGICFLYLFFVLGEPLTETLAFTVVVIVASIPIAIEIVTTTTLALGSRQMSLFGAIVSRLSAIEDLAGMNMLCSDKTGTLTMNKMVIQEETPTYQEGLNQLDLLRLAAMAARWEQPPKDALDTLVLRCHLWVSGATQDDVLEEEKLQSAVNAEMAGYERVDYMPFNPKVKRTAGVVREKANGNVYRVSKGAPHIIGGLVEDKAMVERMMEKVVQLGEDGIRCIAIAKSESFDPTGLESPVSEDSIPVKWHLMGLLTFLDPPRGDTKDTIERAGVLGVPVRMITGDHKLIAKKTARDLNMGDRSRSEWPLIEGPERLPMMDPVRHIPPYRMVEEYGAYIEHADGFAEVFPEHKYLIVETFRRMGYRCGMTGDGVNDAPALLVADVGIAVSGATDAARAAADIILTQPGLSTIVNGIQVSRKIFARMKTFLTYRIAATLQLLVFFFIAVMALPPSDYKPKPGEIDGAHEARQEEWPHYFRLPVLLLLLITLLNDGTLISVGYDNAHVSTVPQRWDLGALFFISSIMGAVACSSSLVLLYLLLDSWNPNGLFQLIGLGGFTYGEIIAAMFLKIAASDFLTLVSARTQNRFFWTLPPHPILVIAAGVALAISTAIALFFPKYVFDGVEIKGLVYGQYLSVLWLWLYVLGIFLIQDAIKVGCFKILPQVKAVFRLCPRPWEKRARAQPPLSASTPSQQMKEITIGDIRGQESSSTDEDDADDNL